MDNQDQTPEDSLHSIRQDLKRMGYLGGSMERWVTPDVSSTAPLVKVSLLAAARIGIIGGVMLGLLMSAGTLMVEGRHLLSDFGDILVFTIYLLILFGLASGILGVVLVGALIASVRAFKVKLSTVRSSSNWAGWSASVVSFIYLLIWWRSNITLLSNGGMPLHLTLLAGVMITAVSLVLGKFFNYAFNVILHRMGGLMPRQERKQKLKTIATALFFIVGISIFMASAGYSKAAQNGVSGAKEARQAGINPVGLKLRVLALDGISYSTLNYLAGSGHMPNLEHLIAKSFRAQMSSPQRIPPQVWVSIATGKPPEKLRIAGYRSKKLKGLSAAVDVGKTNRPLYYALNTILPTLNLAEDVPLSSLARADKTVWEIAAECGFKVGQINWWASWPATPMESFIITDRLLTKLQAEGETPSASLDQSLAHPPEIIDKAREILKSISHIPMLYNDRPLLGKTLHADTLLSRLGASLIKKHSPDLYLLYLPGMDLLIRRLNKGGFSPEIILKFSMDIETYAGFLDGVIAEHYSGHEQGLFMLITDPGNDGKHTLDGKIQHGTFLLSGPGIRSGSIHGAVSSLDVAPTILYLLGLPLSEDMPGKIINEALDDTYWGNFPAKSIKTYGTRKPQKMDLSGSSIDEMHIERLKSLGYIE